MRRIVGYVEGRAVWSENVPAVAHTVSRGGSLVVSHPNAEQRRQVAERVAREKATR